MDACCYSFLLRVYYTAALGSLARKLCVDVKNIPEHITIGKDGADVYIRYTENLLFIIAQLFLFFFNAWV